jgi:hypothetical protein
MEKTLLLAAFIVACGPSDKQPADTAAMAAGPPALAATDLIGTWNGVTMAEGSDSVLARWTVMSTNGIDSKAWFEGSKDTVTYTHTFDADSFIATSSVYADEMSPGKPQAVSRAVGRLIGGKLVGTATSMLASKPDSVLSRTRWEATKAP